RDIFAQMLVDLGSQELLAAESVFPEDGAVGSAALQVHRYAHELMGGDLCPPCPRRDPRPSAPADWYYPSASAPPPRVLRGGRPRLPVPAFGPVARLRQEAAPRRQCRQRGPRRAPAQPGAG